MKSLWKRIESWLAVNAPDILSDLLPGASNEEIHEAERTMHVKFPADVKNSLLIHNGQRGIAAPLMGEWQIFSLKDIVRRWQMLKELLDAGKFHELERASGGSVQSMWWNPKWIPLFYNGAGDYYCLDLAPAAGGKVGQIISFWHTDDKRELLAESYKALLQGFVSDLEKGRYKVEDGELIRSARG